jgi:chemotaxis protein MotB
MMKKDDYNQIQGWLPQAELGETESIPEVDTRESVGMTNGCVLAARRANSRYPTPQTHRLTQTNMETPYLKSQPAPIHWAVGWADLMMTMFVLFLVMYLYQSTQQRQMAKHGLASPLIKTVQQGQSAQGVRTKQQEIKSGDSGKSEKERQTVERQKQETGMLDDRQDDNKMEMARLYDLAVLTLRDQDLAKFADIELSPDRTVRIVLAADLLFPSGNADLGSTAREKIQKIASLLQKTPYMINVVGHTDNVPIKSGLFASNWELSVMRATTVARFLIEEMGVPASQFSVTGHSYYQPQVHNDTSGNRAKNRRVEIIVSREQQPTIPITTHPSLL